MADKSPEWREFERRVAGLFRQLGADVVHDEQVAGSQIDVWVTERTPTGADIRTVVDCKFYRQPVGVDEVRDFNRLSAGLISSGRAERAAMVASNGYTKPARGDAAAFGIVLWEFDDLDHLARRSPRSVSQEARDVVTSAAAVTRVVREQLLSNEPLTLFDFDGLHSDLTKVLDDMGRTLAGYPLAAGRTTAQRRIRSVLSRVEDEMERAVDALAYWRRLTSDVADRDRGFPDSQTSADATSARLMLLREQEQARQMLRNRLRSIEESCARAPWNTSFD